MTIVTQLCVLEPRSRKFLSAISHVLATEHTQFEHFLGRQFGLEIGMKVPADWLGAVVDITRLHQVVNCNSPLSHAIIVAQIGDAQKPSLQSRAALCNRRRSFFPSSLKRCEPSVRSPRRPPRRHPGYRLLASGFRSEKRMGNTNFSVTQTRRPPPPAGSDGGLPLFWVG